MTGRFALSLYPMYKDTLFTIITFSYIETLNMFSKISMIHFKLHNRHWLVMFTDTFLLNLQSLSTKVYSDADIPGLIFGKMW